jgi:hypothetical protein
MFFGMFGSVFLLTQFLQLVLGYSPLQAGIRTLAWTAMPLFNRPRRRRSLGPDRRTPIMAFGLALDAIAFAWIAYNAKVGCPTRSCCRRWFWPASGRHRSSPRSRTW